MKLISWNVNGLRACLTHGFAEMCIRDRLSVSAVAGAGKKGYNKTINRVRSCALSAASTGSCACLLYTSRAG